MPSPLIVRASCLMASLCVLGAASVALPGAAIAQTTARTYHLSGFDSIATAGAVSTRIANGERFSVRLTGKAGDIDAYRVIVRGDELSIAPNPQRPRRKSGAVKAFVTMPALTGINVGGSGDVAADRMRGKQVAISVGGSGNVTVERIEADSATVAVGGSGSVRAGGRSDTLALIVGGSGDADLGELATATASMTVGGSGDIILQATRDATGTVGGSGSVTVRGPARCTIAKSGTGSVRCNAAP